jgi:hypothetical protein
MIMVVAAEDRPLYAIVSGARPATIDDVIATMGRIDAVLADDDGLKWFNRMYMIVTRDVDFNPPGGAWRDPIWLLELDVVFAGLYLDALEGYLSGSNAVPSSWRALLDARHRQGVDRIQFALAGMNAHINRDLAIALRKTNQKCGVDPQAGSPQRADYDAVNQLLNSVMPSTLNMLATDTLGVLAQSTGKVGRLLAFWDICKARDLAWDFAGHLDELTRIGQAVALTSQDQLTGVIGRAILAFG